MGLIGHNIEPPEWVPHGTGRCTCTAEGEDPHCPHHGYEAVIARLRHELAGAVALLREVRAAGAPEGWPVGRRVRWMQEVDALLDGGQ
jgi:hypothetical protein